MQKRPTLRLNKDAAARAGVQLKVDYRVGLNEASGEWEIHRNGVDTKNSRRKRQSAIDLAVRQAKAEWETSKGNITVTTIEGGKPKTQWAGGAKSGPA